MRSRDFSFGLKLRSLALGRSIGELLADALPRFSHDVLGVVLSYAVVGLPRAGVEPVLTLSFKRSFSPLRSTVIVDDQFWLASDGQLMAYNADGEELECLNDFDKYLFDLAVDSQGQVFGACAGGEVVALNKDGTVRCSFGLKPFWGAQSDHSPHDNVRLALHRDLVFVADEVNERVVVFSKSGQYVRSWGRSGRFHPGGIAVSADGEVFVSDYKANKIRVSVFAGVFSMLTQRTAGVQPERQRAAQAVQRG